MPLTLNFMETYEEPTLTRLYELVCKVKDALRVKTDGVKKRKAEEMNDERVTRKTKGFFFEPVNRKRKAFSNCYYCQNPGHNILKCFEYIHDLQFAKIGKRYLYFIDCFSFVFVA